METKDILPEDLESVKSFIKAYRDFTGSNSIRHLRMISAEEGKRPWGGQCTTLNLRASLSGTRR